MAKDQRTDLLRRVPLFEGCSDKELEFISTRVEDMEFAAGRVLCEEGQGGADFFIVLSGTADVKRAGKTIGTMREGDFFGEIALIDHGPRSATVLARTPMRCLVLGPSQFQDVLRENADIARQLLYAVTKRLRRSAALYAD
jgi:CRP/FNR family cyclic AMP-dependent transcriptional regulator